MRRGQSRSRAITSRTSRTVCASKESRLRRRIWPLYLDNPGFGRAARKRFRAFRLGLPDIPVLRAVHQSSSCPGLLSRASTSCQFRCKKDVDGRDKPGHDEQMGQLSWKMLWARSLSADYAVVVGLSSLPGESVKISTPSLVTPTECSNCAESERSRVTAVQPSERILTCGLPRLIIGSIVKNMPALSVTPSPGRPTWMIFGSSWNIRPRP